MSGSTKISLKICITCLVFTPLSFLSCGEKATTWDEQGLENVISFTQEIGTFALVIQAEGEIVASYGRH